MNQKEKLVSDNEKSEFDSKEKVQVPQIQFKYYSFHCSLHCYSIVGDQIHTQVRRVHASGDRIDETEVRRTS